MGDSVIKHTTALPRANQASQSGQADKPDRRVSRFNERGVALQTVIIMVVLLAIAGTVAAVLLSRASDVTGELESTDVSGDIDTGGECVNFRMGTKPGVTTPPTITGSNPITQCLWTDDDGVPNNGNVTRGRCQLVGGTYAPDAAAGGSGATCTLAVT